MSVHVTLSSFEGPLDLLLHLIAKARIDIRDIFVSQITEQYLAIVREAGSIDMDSGSEFLEMAATLLFIKSRALLPKPPKPEPDEEDEDPEQALIRKLIEYKAFKEASASLHDMEHGMIGTLTKLPEEIVFPPQEPVLLGSSLDALGRAFLRAMRRARDAEERFALPRQIEREAYTVPDKIRAITRALKRRGQIDFESMMEGARDRYEVIVTFLAVLELLKLGRISARQDAAFGLLTLHMEEGARFAEHDDGVDAYR